MLRAVGSTDATVGGGKSRKSGRGAGNGKGPNGGGGGGLAELFYDPAETHTNVTLSSSNQLATRTTGTGLGGTALTTVSKSSGKWYTEFLVVAGSSSNIGVGVATSSYIVQFPGPQYLGSTTASWAYFGDGSRYFNGSATAGFATFTAGDVISVAWNADTGKLWYGKNGTWLGSGDPAAGTNESQASVTGTCRAGAECWGNTSSIRVRSQSQYTQTIPSGFSAWG